MVMSLILLNLAGGECVDDLRILEKDEGLCRVLRRAETHRTRRAETRRTSEEEVAQGPSAQCAVSVSVVSDTSVSFTTPPRRTEGSRTERSYRLPTMRCADSARSTPTWWASSSVR